MKHGKGKIALTVILLLLSGFCFAIPGIRFSGGLFSILAGISFLSFVLDRLSRNSLFFNRCKVIFHAGILCLLAGLCLLEIWVLKDGRKNPAVQPVDAVIVLGAGVNGTRPSLALQTRIDAAETYLTAHREVPVVLSGGQGDGENISEALAMWNALTAKGIEPERLILEECSTNTEENFRFSGELLQQQGIDPKTASIAIVTNDFHLARAGWIAKKQGYHITVGVPAVLPWWWLNVNYFIREPFAMVKALIF